MGRKAGRSGKLYSITRGSLVDTGDLTTGSWYQIVSRGGTSALPDVPLLSLFRPATATTLAAGDSVYPLTITECGFARDVKRAGSKEKFDMTTQVDTVATFVVDEIVDTTGTIDGVFDTTDPQVQAVMAQFADIVEYAADDTPTVSALNSDVIRFLLSRDEDGDPEVWQYMPMVIDSLNEDKPMKDAQMLSFNYTLVGTEFPHTVRINKV